VVRNFIYPERVKPSWLAQVIRGLHMSIGITPPPAEQAWIYALVWFGVWLAIVSMFILLFAGIHYEWF
jgi:hypothetical protein